MAILDPILNLPKPQKIAIGVVGLVALAALGYFLVFATVCLAIAFGWRR